MYVRNSISILCIISIFFLSVYYLICIDQCIIEEISKKKQQKKSTNIPILALQKPLEMISVHVFDSATHRPKTHCRTLTKSTCKLFTYCTFSPVPTTHGSCFCAFSCVVECAVVVSELWSTDSRMRHDTGNY